MYKLLIKTFIKDFKHTQNIKVRHQYGLLSSIFGIITNTLLCIGKVIIGIIAGSIAIIADGINNLTDSGSSLITLIAFKFAGKEPDPEHPFGHQRIEYVSGLVVAIIIIAIGIILVESSIIKIINKTPINLDNFIILIIVLLFSILIKLWQWFAYRYTGRIIESRSLFATATDSLNDVIATSAILLSVIVYKITEINIDGYMGVAVAIFIIISGIMLVKEATSLLLGEAPSPEMVSKITNKILSYEGVLGIHDLVIHSYGPAKTYITVHVEVDANNDLKTTHEIIDKIERDFLEDFNYNLVIHMDPVDLKDQLSLKIKTKIEEIITKINQEISFHDFRIVRERKSINILFDIVIPNEKRNLSKVIKKQIENEIRLLDKKYNPIITIDYQNTF